MPVDVATPARAHSQRAATGSLRPVNVLEGVTPRDFYDEAKIHQGAEQDVRKQFQKFSANDTYLTFQEFLACMEHYDAIPMRDVPVFFYAMNRSRDDKLKFEEFFLGCCAASLNTPHFLNSFTGEIRSQFIFDIYDVNGSGRLEFAEFEHLVADCMRATAAAGTAKEEAMQLGLCHKTGHFRPLSQADLYELVKNETLRGTSALFRFQRGAKLLGASSRSNSGSRRLLESETRGATKDNACICDEETCEWHAMLLDIDEDEDAQREARGALEHVAPSEPRDFPLVPPSPIAAGAGLSACAEESIQTIAGRVLQCLASPHFEGLAPPALHFEGLSFSSPFTLLNPAEIHALCDGAMWFLEREDMVLSKLAAPVKIFGAIHGQIYDLLSHFKWHGRPVRNSFGDLRYNTYLFLGDYADRGGYGLEVLMLLLSLKVLYPSSVVLLRGSHENRQLNYHLGLRDECEQRLGRSAGTKVYEHLNEVFECMSLAAKIGGRLLALGPGRLASSLTRVDQLQQLRKPLVVPHPDEPLPESATEQLEHQLVLELFTPADLLPPEKGSAQDALPEPMLKRSGLTAVVTGHGIPPHGFAFEQGNRHVRLCSCLNYCDAQGGNDASILCVTREPKSQNLRLQPRVITARVAKIYSVLGSKLREDVASRRWPAQRRALTPSRHLCAEPGGHALVLLEKDVVSDTSAAAPTAFPAFGPGRWPQTRAGNGDARGRVLAEIDPQNPTAPKKVGAPGRNGSRPPLLKA